MSPTATTAAISSSSQACFSREWHGSNFEQPQLFDATATVHCAVLHPTHRMGVRATIPRPVLEQSANNPRKKQPDTIRCRTIERTKDTQHDRYAGYRTQTHVTCAAILSAQPRLEPRIRTGVGFVPNRPDNRSKNGTPFGAACNLQEESMRS